MISTTESSVVHATPAKVVLERRARPGAELALIGWIERFTASAARAPGHEGTSVLSSESGARFILLRFATHPHLQDWRESSDYVRLIREADDVSFANEHEQEQSGLETWFTLPDRPMPSSPPAKWKMAVLTWSSLFPIASAMGALLGPLPLPVVVRTAISTAIPVALLTWVLMPRITRLFYPWLYNHQRQTEGES